MSLFPNLISHRVSPHNKDYFSLHNDNGHPHKTALDYNTTAAATPLKTTFIPMTTHTHIVALADAPQIGPSVSSGTSRPPSWDREANIKYTPVLGRNLVGKQKRAKVLARQFYLNYMSNETSTPATHKQQMRQEIVKTGGNRPF